MGTVTDERRSGDFGGGIGRERLGAGVSADGIPGETPSGRVRRRILVVDDEEAMRDILSGLLSFMGFEVAVARNGREGLKLFSVRAYDLVLTDFRMPGMDGLSLASSIKGKSPHTPIVLITGEDREGMRKRLEGSCINSALFKPFDLKEFEETVQTLMMGSGLHS